MRDKNILVVDYVSDRVIFFIERFGHHKLDITENSNDAVRYLVDNIYDCLFLGGELGKYGGNCCDVAKFLCEHDENPNFESLIILHALDIESAGYIIKLLPQVQYVPYSESALSALNI